MSKEGQENPHDANYHCQYVPLSLCIGKEKVCCGNIIPSKHVMKIWFNFSKLTFLKRKHVQA